MAALYGPYRLGSDLVLLVEQPGTIELRRVRGSADAVLDFEVTTAQQPAPSNVHPVTTSGVVFETTVKGKQPVPGVGVLLEQYFDMVIAGTWSDGAGRYMLCGLVPGDSVAVFTTGGGYAMASTEFFRVTGSAEIDIEVSGKACRSTRCPTPPELSGG